MKKIIIIVVVFVALTMGSCLNGLDDNSEVKTEVIVFEGWEIAKTPYQYTSIPGISFLLIQRLDLRSG